MPRPYVFKPGVRYTIKQDDENTIGYEILDSLKQDNVLVRNVAAQDDKSEVHSMEALRRSLWAGKLKRCRPSPAVPCAVLVVDKEDRSLTKQRSFLVTRDLFTGRVLAFFLGEQEDKMSKPSSVPSDQSTS